MNEQPLVFVLDAGGTGLKFSAVCEAREIIDQFTIPSSPNSLSEMIERIVDGFHQTEAKCGRKPTAISFSFPGPADYANGIIGDLGNIPCFRGGVPLKDILENIFHVPVFINNDGDLFAYGEALAGLLPEVNQLLEQQGNPKRYHNLLGVTLGTGFGGGIVVNGRLHVGDNSAGGEIWCFRNMLHPTTIVEDSLTVRAVRRIYAEASNIQFDEAPQPVDIYNIAMGNQQGNQQAAQQAWNELGVVLADSIANAITLIDGLVVIGGGLSKAWQAFFPTMMKELAHPFCDLSRSASPRLELDCFSLQDESSKTAFAKPTGSYINIPNSDKKVWYDPMKKTGIGVSRLGTSTAVAVGAYAFAKEKLGF